jgi:dihydropyrimidine dehydrogenase (NAD+) subunit PreA
LNVKGIARVEDLVGRAVPAYQEWGELDLNHHAIAVIHEEKCIGCHLCIVACHDGAHQCVHPPKIAPENGRVAVPWVDVDECVGCNLCALVCPVDGCIEMVERRRAPEVETWNDRVRKGTDRVPGGLEDLRKMESPSAPKPEVPR